MCAHRVFGDANKKPLTEITFPFNISDFRFGNILIFLDDFVKLYCYKPFVKRSWREND